MRTHRRSFIRLLAPIFVVASICAAAFAQEPAPDLEFIAAHTSIQYTLDDPLHSVHGTFSLKRGQIHYDPATGAVGGDIVADAISGQSGSARARRQNAPRNSGERTISGNRLPPRSRTGKSRRNRRIHRASPWRFSHSRRGARDYHPVQVELAPDHWTATAHFDIPYVKWGIKDPSNFFLHVSKSVAIDIHASGPIPPETPSSK